MALWTFLFAAGAFFVAVAQLARDEWQRRHEIATAVQFLHFQTYEVEIRHRDGGEAVHVVEPKITARGPGTRFDVETFVWIDEHTTRKWDGTKQRFARFDNTCEPLTCGRIELVESDRARAWFGLRYNAPRLERWSSGGLRSHYARQNLGTSELQLWRWYSFGETRKWWGRQRIRSKLGRHEPVVLGRWTRARLRPALKRQFPTWDGHATD